MEELALLLQQPRPPELTPRRKRPPLAKVVGTPAAKEAKLVKERQKLVEEGKGGRYPEVGEVESSYQEALLRRKDPRPLTTAEQKRFETSMVSKRTAAVRKSHLKKVTAILRREFLQESRQDSTRVMLEKWFTVDGITRVSAALAAEGISSAAHYLTTWKGEIDEKVKIAKKVKKRKRLCARTLKKYGRPASQAVEIPLGVLQSMPWRLRKRALHTGGLMYPGQAALTMSLLMLRGLAARSMRRTQVKTTTRGITLRFGTRKNEQSNRCIRELPLSCTCRVSAANCLHCQVCLHRELTRTAQPGATHVFTNEWGKPVTAKALGLTLKAVAKLMEVPEAATVTPHTCRISGARHWAAEGASEGTFASLGDWRNREVLRKYIATTGIAKRLENELSRGRTCEKKEEKASAVPVATPVAAIEETNAKLLTLQCQKELAIVSRHRPRKWHLVSAIGPSSAWRTRCGDVFNSSSMDIQWWGEFSPPEERCRSCRA